MVKPDLQQIKNEITSRGLTAYEIAKYTPLSEDGINKILTGASKSPRTTTLLILHEFLFGKEEAEKEKTPLGEARFEDLLAKKVAEIVLKELPCRVAENLKPFIQQKTDDLLKVIGSMQTDFLELRNLQEEIRATQQQMNEKVDKLQ